MEYKNIDRVIKYFNDVLAKHEERIVVLTGRTQYARFGFEITGADFIRSLKISGKILDEMMDKCIKEITTAGIAGSITYSPSPLPYPEGEVEFKVSGCIHLSKEAKIIEDGITPFICPLGNMLSTVILENAEFEVGSFGIRGGSGNINLDTKECTLKGLICKNIDQALAISSGE
jgi:hypothetical protein